MPNYTITGSTSDDFWRVAQAFLKLPHNYMWSSVCDKIGVWAISLEDDTPRDLIISCLRGADVDEGDVEAIEYGEMIFQTEALLEAEGFYEGVRRRIWPEVRR